MTRTLAVLAVAIPTAILIWERLPVALAQTPPPTATCIYGGKWGPTRATDAEQFMNEQLTAGRTRFVPYGPAVLCAW